MSAGDSISHGRGRWSPLGIVGPGASPGSGEDRPREPDTEETPDAHTSPRRFVVPGGALAGDASAETLARLRRLVREGGILLGADQTSLFVFGAEGDPVRRLVRFRLAERAFDPPEEHPAGLGREVRTLLSAVSRAEVGDLERHAPPPGAMRDYLVGAGVRGLLSLPLRAESGRIAGFLSFEATAGTRTWTERDRVRAQELASEGEAILAASPGPWAALDDPGGVASPVEEATGKVPARSSPSVTGATRATRASAGRTHSAFDESPDAHEWDGTVARELRTSLPRLSPLEGAALLAADVADDLREALDVQEGLQLLLEQSVRPADREIVGDLRELSGRVRRGVETVLRATHSGPRGEEVVDLSRALTSSVHRLAVVAGNGPRFLVAPCADPLPVRGDAALLARALEHLVRNAASAVRPGGRIRVSWERARVLRSGEESAGPLEVARIRVDDDGRGIRPEHLPWVFEPYFSTEPEEVRPRGIGLSAVQAVVEGHGGWVDLHSRPGEGTLVKVHLPLAGAAEEPDAEGTNGSGPARGGLVLVVEDDPALARFMVRVLERGDYAAEVATSVGEADRIWAVRGEEFDAVLVERRLAGAGRGGAQPWRRGRDTPVIHVDRRGGSATSGRDVSDEDFLLVPPFDPLEIVRLVEECVGREEHVNREEGVGLDERVGPEERPSRPSRRPGTAALEPDDRRSAPRVPPDAPADVHPPSDFAH